MTTVVYHDGIIAYDSLYTAGDIIVDHFANKKTTRNGVTFIFCGTISDENELIKGYFGDVYDNMADTSAIVDDNGRVYVASVCDKDGFWKQDITHRSYCLGNGEKFAWAALDCGRNAKQAVSVAINRDVYTGGKVSLHYVKGRKK